LPDILTLEFSAEHAPALFGEHNSHIAYLEKKLNIDIADRGSVLTLQGDHAALHQAEHIFSSLLNKAKKGQAVDTQDIDAIIRFWDAKKKDGDAMDDDKQDEAVVPRSSKDIVIKTKKKTIVPRSPNQEKYLRSILDHDMVFGLGPAGTGKTYLAVAVGMSMYLSGQVDRLIFTRPAVEAGENLGFLPGDMREKIDPYLRPIYDAMHDMVPWDFMMKKMEDGDIEVAPLAFMRGRTLSNAFVILDEGQNTTRRQMKMFLTRMGEASRMVITGDLTQTDLPHGQISGLRDAVDTLHDIDDIAFNHFDKGDVVRHPLVSKIVNAYEKQAAKDRMRDA
jgi:phosphate starvation-inducible PhoH-like protein